MKDDDLTRGIAAALAEEARGRARDAKWEALSNNELTPDERAELEALAANDPAAGDAFEAYAPLGSAFEDQIAQSFLDSGAAAPSREIAESPQEVREKGASQTAPGPKAALARSNVVRLGTFIAAPLALAAGIALFIGQRGGAGDTLPPYAIAVSSDVKAERGGSTQIAGDEARIHPRAFFEIVVRPSVPPREPIDARAVLVREGRPSAWNVPIAISNEGAVRIAGRADTLFPEATGAYEIVVALAPKAALPDERTLLGYAADGTTVPARVRVVRARVEIIGE